MAQLPGEKRSLLLTGATGFVGRNLLLRLLKEKDYSEIYLPVRSLKKLDSQLKSEGIQDLPEGVRAFESSAKEWHASGLPVDDVIHCAGMISGQTEAEYFSANVEGTLNLLAEVPSAKRYLILSSQAATGPNSASQEVRVEGEVDSPVTWYGKSKLEMEARLKSDHADKNLLVLRPPMVLGPRDAATLPLFKLAKSPVRVKAGTAAKTYSFISVTDLVEGILAVLNSKTHFHQLPSRYLFIASSQTITDRDLISAAGTAIGKQGAIIGIPHGALKLLSKFIDPFPRLRTAIPNLSRDRVNEILPFRWVISPKQFEQTFGWQASRGLLSTMKETADWYRRQKAI